MTAFHAAPAPAPRILARAPARASVRERDVRRAAAAGVVLTLWVGAVLQLAHQGQHERHEIAPCCSGCATRP